jgi:protein tyrosine/serine phosphatase
MPSEGKHGYPEPDRDNWDWIQAFLARAFLRSKDMNVKLVSPGIYRGPSPKQPDDWRALKALGIDFALDLQTGSSLMGDGSPLQETLNAEDFAIRSYAHPLGEFILPTHLELDQAMNFIVGHPNVYVHCKTGVDRTGMVIAYYRMHKEQWSKERAIAEMREMGMHWWFFYWVWSLK